ncbi:hypothetical protein QYF36_020836 [Acer negundo]|nr:hypothetical protein QYF36_020836 [Acer negundo]
MRALISSTEMRSADEGGWVLLVVGDDGKMVHNPKQNQPSTPGRKIEASETAERALELRMTWSMHRE